MMFTSAYQAPFYSPFFVPVVSRRTNAHIAAMRRDVQVQDTADNYQISIRVPDGVAAADMTAQLEQDGRVLRICGGAQGTTSFEKQVAIRQRNLDASKLTANFSDGVLVVSAPKIKREEPKTHKITITENGSNNTAAAAAPVDAPAPSDGNAKPEPPAATEATPEEQKKEGETAEPSTAQNPRSVAVPNCNEKMTAADAAKPSEEISSEEKPSEPVPKDDATAAVKPATEAAPAAETVPEEAAPAANGPTTESLTNCLLERGFAPDLVNQAVATLCPMAAAAAAQKEEKDAKPEEATPPTEAPSTTEATPAAEATEKPEPAAAPATEAAPAESAAAPAPTEAAPTEAAPAKAAPTEAAPAEAAPTAAPTEATPAPTPAATEPAPATAARPTACSRVDSGNTPLPNNIPRRTVAGRN